VARSVDGFYARQAEIPYDILLDEGGDETAAGTVHMDGDIEPRPLLVVVQRVAYLLDRLVL